VAARVTLADPGRVLLDKIDAREQALTREAGQTQARIDELTARLRELDEAISDLQVTRKTLLSLAGQGRPGRRGTGRRASSAP
jgi:prefoldin subunit 5